MDDTIYHLKLYVDFRDKKDVESDLYPFYLDKDYCEITSNTD